MSRLKIILYFLVLILIPVYILPSCKSSRKSTCNTGSYHKKYNAKKNRNGYNQKYSFKSRSIRKDYVIKNGIAN